MALAQKLGREDDLELGVFGTDIPGVANRDSGLNDYNGARVDFFDQIQDALNARCVEVVRDIIIVGWRSYDDVISYFVCLIRIGGSVQRSRAICQICLDECILDRGDAAVDVGYPVFVNVDSNDFVVFGKQAGE